MAEIINGNGGAPRVRFERSISIGSVLSIATIIGSVWVGTITITRQFDGLEKRIALVELQVKQIRCEMHHYECGQTASQP